MFVEVIGKETFNNKIKIRFNNIIEGFEKFNYFNIIPKENDELIEQEKKFIKLIKEFSKINSSTVIIDFYKNRLNKEAINIIKANLRSEEFNIINKILNTGSSEDVYFQINNIDYLDPLVKLCTREIFFITFYFDKGTLWGNYNMTFPFFYESKEAIADYEKAIVNNLECRIYI